MKTLIHDLQILCIESIKSEKTPTKKLPINLQQIISSLYFINKKSAEYKRYYAAESIQEQLNFPSIIAGGFASFVCEETLFYGDIDIFCLIPIELQSEEKIKIFFKERTVETLDEINIRLKLINRVYPQSNGLLQRVLTFKCSDGTTIDVILKATPHFHRIWCKPIDIGKEICKTFDIDICKCIGLNLPAHKAVFFPLKSNQIFENKTLKKSTTSKVIGNLLS